MTQGNDDARLAALLEEDSFELAAPNRDALDLAGYMILRLRTTDEGEAKQVTAWWSRRTSR